MASAIIHSNVAGLMLGRFAEAQKSWPRLINFECARRGSQTQSLPDSPEELMRGEKYARANGFDVSRLLSSIRRSRDTSQYDLEHAWPT
jgi:hypothetical protein